ncbi:5-formyltetrahydrofolate cyclo-ligase [Thalassotalea profundi]|uniref:5-formyltetrahydrofolate cyclo-ligase n=1 Tax=Thalassotalea profundi TaxID=2036687 RepID=A0ABQ3IJC4_9GAMM|nr:5-formyltetrahydrofolate cyclo-ligase [Thalassotalea profundi]GHE80473.1 5-formyltetrahydrofolate cyclo-ligase [Thalassotalea profundi]
MSNSTLISPNQLRKTIRQRRQQLTAPEQVKASQLLLEQLAQRLLINKVKNIAIYLSNDGELETELVIKWCWKQGITTYLPVIHPFSKGHLLFLHYHQDSVMQTNKYGILEPKLNIQNIIPAQNLDIIFTPLVAFDTKGNRIGMGGGFYDRTLAKWYQDYRTNPHATPRPIGIAHDCQKVEDIPTQSWDIPLPEIITPTQHFTFSLHK